MAAVETEQLVRTYRRRDRREEVVALDGLSLTIEEGEVYGLLGLNGAGKPTLVKVLSTILLPTKGTARILGLDVVADIKSVRKQIGIVFGGDRGLYPWISARHNLNYWAALYNVPGPIARQRVEGLLQRLASKAASP